MDKKESRKISNKKHHIPPLAKPVAKFLNNMLIERYVSIREAAKANEVTSGNITWAIKKKEKLNGLLWKFV